MSQKSTIGIACITAIGMLVMLMYMKPASASFSAFVVITPENAAEYHFQVQAQPMDNQAGLVRVRVIGPVDGDKKAWLITCKQSLLPDKQNFRSVLWEGKAHDKDIVQIKRLTTSKGVLPETGEKQLAYVEVVLSSEEMKHSYLYIDYPRMVDDGGYYYSIDLAYYLPGPLAKKSMIQWEKN